MSHMKICLVHPNPGAICEAFIRAHVSSLPGVSAVLYGGHMPLFDQAERILHSELPLISSLLFSPDGVGQTEEHELAARSMASYLSANDISVVLAEYGPTGVAMLKPCSLSGVPLVVHFHGYDVSLKQVLEKYRAGYGRLFSRASAIVAVSFEMKRDLMAFGAPGEKIAVNPCGVDPSVFCLACPADSPPHFIAVGRFVDKKAPETVIEAFSEVARRVDNATLTMIGDGVLRGDCMRMAGNMGLSDLISFPGTLPHVDVAREMRRARCFVQHSVTALTGDKEGTPVSVLEASASGLPVVSTRHAGIVEAVVHGQTGLLCEEYDLASMTRHMLKMAEYPELAETYGKAGREHVKARYDIQDRMKDLHAILETAVKEIHN